MDLGASQGKKHSTPDLTKDIDTLMASLRLHKVYVYSDGCVLDDDEKPAADIISVGLATLTHSLGSNMLDEFNAQFNVNQAWEQCQIKPVSELLHRLNQPVEVSTSSPSMITIAPTTPCHITLTTSTNAADSGAPSREIELLTSEEDRDSTAEVEPAGYSNA